jgi:hypothetical protein
MQWISVNDRLPENRMLHVLVFNGTAPEYNQHVFQAVWFRQRAHFKAFWKDHSYLGEITHWMPLPLPPGAEQPCQPVNHGSSQPSEPYNSGPLSGLPCDLDINSPERVRPLNQAE